MKNWWQSRTIWVNALTLLTALLVTASGSELVKQYPKAASVLAAALATVNILMRWVTVLTLK